MLKFTQTFPIRQFDPFGRFDPFCSALSDRSTGFSEAPERREAFVACVVGGAQSEVTLL